MAEGRPVLYFFAVMIVLMFYWVINSHFIEIKERESLILELQDTIILQQRVIDVQKRQTELLLQIYYNNNPIQKLESIRQCANTSPAALRRVDLKAGTAAALNLFVHGTGPIPESLHGNSENPAN